MTIIAKLSFNKHLNTYSRKQGFLKDSQNYLTAENQKTTEISNYFTHCPLTWMILEKSWTIKLLGSLKSIKKPIFNITQIMKIISTYVLLLNPAYPLLIFHIPYWLPISVMLILSAKEILSILRTETIVAR